MIAVSTQIWVAFEMEGVDGPGAARDLFLSVDLEAREIKSAILGRYGVNTACPLPVLMILVGGDRWAAFVRDVLTLAERRADEVAYIGTDARAS
jgi:hypothetical protein